MPYNLKRVYDEKYKVYGPSGAKSKKGMTLRNAKRQLRLLNAIEHNPDFKPRKK